MRGTLSGWRKDIAPEGANIDDHGPYAYNLGNLAGYTLGGTALARYTVQLWNERESFIPAVQDSLRRNEAANNLILGLLSAHQETPFPILATVYHDGRLVLTAIQTDPHTNLVLSFSNHLLAIDPLVKVLYNQTPCLPGVLGSVDLVTHFVEKWGALTGVHAHLDVQERIFSIQTVQDANYPRGHMRWADPSDADWLAVWIEKFTKEALPYAPSIQAKPTVTHRLEQGWPNAGYLVMEEEVGPVSLAGFGGPTGQGIRLGPVYTPPAFRNQGYGSEVIHALTRRLLHSRYQSVYLYTDLANSTSNHIYQKIGYRAVMDVNQFSFHERA